jgi:hypothetical protein
VNHLNRDMSTPDGNGETRQNGGRAVAAGGADGMGFGMTGLNSDIFGAMNMSLGSGEDQDGDLSGRVIVVGPDGVGRGNDGGGDSGENPMNVAEMVEQPAKVMRIGSMIKQLLEEVRAAPLDEASRVRLREIHHSSIAELEKGLAPELVNELERLSLPFAEDEVPSESELRIAQAQLVGWLEGLFHGLQAALVAQQMAARNQLEQMRGRALPGPMMQDPRAQNSGGPYL